MIRKQPKRRKQRHPSSPCGFVRDLVCRPAHARARAERARNPPHEGTTEPAPQSVEIERNAVSTQFIPEDYRQRSRQASAKENRRLPISQRTSGGPKPATEKTTNRAGRHTIHSSRSTSSRPFSALLTPGTVFAKGGNNPQNRARKQPENAPKTARKTGRKRGRSKKSFARKPAPMLDRRAFDHFPAK